MNKWKIETEKLIIEWAVASLIEDKSNDKNTYKFLIKLEHVNLSYDKPYNWIASFYTNTADAQSFKLIGINKFYINADNNTMETAQSMAKDLAKHLY